MSRERRRSRAGLDELFKVANQTEGEIRSLVWLVEIEQMKHVYDDHSLVDLDFRDACETLDEPLNVAITGSLDLGLCVALSLFVGTSVNPGCRTISMRLICYFVTPDDRF